MPPFSEARGLEARAENPIRAHQEPQQRMFEHAQDSEPLSAEEESFFDCPYCWQRISMLIEADIASQSYVEDCEVCCNPIQVRVRALAGGRVEVEADRAQ